jgi:large repetitive protein
MAVSWLKKRNTGAQAGRKSPPKRLRTKSPRLFLETLETRLAPARWSGAIPSGTVWTNPIGDAGPAVSQTAPTITSPNSATFTVGVLSPTFTVTTTGNPTPSLTISPTTPLPSGLNFVDNGDGTATMNGTPAAGTGRSHVLLITATNGVSPNAMQFFMLTIDEAPVITSVNAATFTVGQVGPAFNIQARGTPIPSLTIPANSLPSCLSFADNTHGTATINGTPAAGTAGTYTFVITAANGISPNAMQSFTLTVNLASSATVIVSDSFNRPNADRCFLGQADLAFGGSGAHFYLPIFGGTNPIGANIVGNVLENNGLDYGGVQFTADPNACTDGSRGENLGQDLTIQVDLMVPLSTSGSASITEAGPYFRGRAAASGDGIIGGQNSGYWVQLFSSGGVAVLNLSSGAFVAGTNSQPAFDPFIFHRLVVTASGSNLQVFLDGVLQTFMQNGNTVTTVSIPYPGGSDDGTVGVAFADETNRGTLGGEEADNLIVESINPQQQAPAITSANNTSFTVGTSGPAFTITATGTPAPSLAIPTGSLPSGLSFIDNGNGTATINGTPAAGTAGTYTFVITASNSVAPNATQNFSLTVNLPAVPPTLGSLAPTQWTVNQPNYPGAIAISNGTAPFGNLMVSGLPAGLSASINGSTISIGGTPTQTGTFNNIHVSMTDAAGASASGTYTLTINGPLNINPTAIPGGIAGVAYNQTITAGGGTGVKTISDTITSGTIPTGLSFSTTNGDPATLTITGTPSATGTVAFLVTVVDAVGSTASQSYSLTIGPAMTATHLAFVQQPTDTAPGNTISPAVTVAILDSFNNLTPSTANVTLIIASGPAGSTLRGTTTVAAVGGVATFPNLVLKTAGAYTLAAGSLGLTGSTSNSFTTRTTPSASRFFISAPTSANPGVAFSITVTAKDNVNNTVTSYSGTVHFTSTDRLAVLPADATLTNGVGTFSVTLNTLGVQEILATDTIRASVTGSATMRVAPPVSVLFAPVATYGPIRPLGPQSMVTGDFDHDGNPDLAVANSDATISVFLNNGDGTFRAPIVVNTFGHPYSALAVADINGDGKLDLVGTFFSGFDVLLGNGDGTFRAPITTAGSGTNYTSLAVGDFNGDGKPDVAVVNISSNHFLTTVVSIFLNQGNRTFMAARDISIPGAAFVIAADFSGDGRLDLAVATVANSVVLLMGHGDGTFTSPLSYSVPTSLGPPSLAVGDFNGDGRLDIVVADSGSVSVLLGAGKGTFLPPISTQDIGPGLNPGASAVAVGDFDGDGRLDVAVTIASTNTVSVLPGDGAGGLMLPISFQLGGGVDPVSLAVADFNGDGKPDIAVASSGATGLEFTSISVLLTTSPLVASALAAAIPPPNALSSVGTFYGLGDPVMSDQQRSQAGDAVLDVWRCQMSNTIPSSDHYRSVTAKGKAALTVAPITLEIKGIDTLFEAHGAGLNWQIIDGKLQA